jgi:hypothetical protein
LADVAFVGKIEACSQSGAEQRVVVAARVGLRRSVERNLKFGSVRTDHIRHDEVISPTVLKSKQHPPEQSREATYPLKTRGIVVYQFLNKAIDKTGNVA